MIIKKHTKQIHNHSKSVEVRNKYIGGTAKHKTAIVFIYKYAQKVKDSRESHYQHL